MKNLKNSILVLFVFALTKMFGQTVPEVNFAVTDSTTAIEDVSYEYLMAHRVYLRSSPSKKGEKLAVLDIGTKLVIREKSENAATINGIKSNWYRVSIGADEGWIWGGLIAQKTFGSQAYHDVKFVYGLESVKTNKEGILEKKHQLRAFKNGVQIDKIVFNGHESVPLEIKNIGNKGLFNVEDIITFNVPGLENGTHSGKMYIFWNNDRFTNVASLVGYSDASYSKTESFIFPSDMKGIKSTIVLETVITNHAPLTENEIAKNNKKLIVSFYKWDGYKLVKKETSPTIAEDILACNH